MTLLVIFNSRQGISEFGAVTGSPFNLQGFGHNPQSIVSLSSKLVRDGIVTLLILGHESRVVVVPAGKPRAASTRAPSAASPAILISSGSLNPVAAHHRQVEAHLPGLN